MTENKKNEKKRYKQLTFWFQVFLIFFLFLFIVGFVLVMLNAPAEKWIGGLLGLTDDTAKNRILSFIGIGMGGILIALQALASYKRAKAMEDAANAHAQANQNTELGQRQERLKNAIEHLGHDSVSVRLGGAYELFHLAEDNRELNQTVLDILCAHIRQTTSEREYRENYPVKPSEEIQSLLTLLFVSNHRVFLGCHINLQKSWLNGANLRKARLTNAGLGHIYLENANINETMMQGVDLINASLTQANFTNAEIQGAWLINANLTNSILSGAKMQGANLMYANMENTTLKKTQMQAVSFYNAQIQKTHFINTQIQGAKFRQPYYEENFEFIIKSSMYKEDDFNTLHFDDIANKKKIQKGIITGHYNEEEAEEWIAEYKKAVAVFSDK